MRDLLFAVTSYSGSSSATDLVAVGHGAAVRAVRHGQRGVLALGARPAARLRLHLAEGAGRL